MKSLFIIPPTLSMRRIYVVGTTGSGKSTLAKELAQRLDVPYIELDALYWGPNWSHCSNEELRQRTDKATKGEAWVVDGNYSSVRDLIWPRAQAAIWLDYPLIFILWQLWKRTWKRVLTKETLWGINQETFWPHFFSKDSLFLWALKTYRRHKQTYATLISSPENITMKVYHFKTAKETEVWLHSWV
jgi:adenylate kinase family enzyme